MPLLDTNDPFPAMVISPRRRLRFDTEAIWREWDLLGWLADSLGRLAKPPRVRQPRGPRRRDDWLPPQCRPSPWFRRWLAYSPPRPPHDPNEDGMILFRPALHEQWIRSGAPDPRREEDALWPQGSRPGLVVVRGRARGTEYALREGPVTIGRDSAADGPDIDLGGQEPPDQARVSPRHARVVWDGRTLTLEDLGSCHGTYLNRGIISPTWRRRLVPGDVIQVGAVQLKVVSLA